MLEAEVLGLRQNLAEVKANRDELRKEVDDLRRDRGHWRKLAEPGEPKREAPRSQDLVLRPGFGGRLSRCSSGDRQDDKFALVTLAVDQPL
jgi:hypothetical protein